MFSLAKQIIDKKSDKIMIILAFFTLLSTVIGIIINHTNVPYFDMWDGYVGFYLSVHDGHYEAWWGQHNEHRFVLTRLFIWLDIRFFAGLGWFMNGVNFCLSLLIVFVLNLFLQEHLKDTKISGYSKTLITCFLVMVVCFWSQKNNYIVPFESHFFLSVLIPLTSFYFLHHFNSTKNVKLHFAGILLALIAPLTMTNGIILLPLVAIYVYIFNKNIFYFFFTLVLSAISIFIYFHNYSFGIENGSLLDSLIQHPFVVLHYVALYIANPFYYLLWRGSIIAVLVSLIGYAFLFSIVMVAYKMLFKEKLNSLKIALLFMIIFIGASIFSTALGRISFGSTHALSNRYSTASLVLWACFGILMISTILYYFEKYKKITSRLFFVVIFLMMTNQIEALFPSQKTYQVNIAGLTAVLGVKDKEKIGKIYPSLEPTLTYAKRFNDLKLSYTNVYPFAQSREMMNKTAITNTITNKCLIKINTISSIEGEKVYQKITGVLYNDLKQSYPQRIEFLDDKNTYIGFALNISPVKLVINDKKYTSFEGYILADSASRLSFIWGVEKDGVVCTASITP